MRKWYYILAIILLFPALLINLGLPVFIDDEAIRALVAQEMLWSDNFIAPTLHADAYLNKPPLWNWILAVSFELHGAAGEWAARLPTVISLLGFGLTTYLFSRPHFGRYLAFVHALTVITCGRMLFWDSMLALIDVCFSWVIYTQIMLLYYYGRRGEWWRAFGWTYLLTAVAFMLKGLPAIVFQGLTVFAVVGWQRSWHELFRPAHLLSGVGCLLLLGTYYYTYGQYVDLAQVAQRLFVESGKRTAVAHGAGETLRHLLAFPFEMSYHFLPWTILLAYLLRRGSWSRLLTSDFAAFCLLAFVVHLPVYWLSPNVYPRYLLMLFPLLFASLLWLHRSHASRGSRTYLTLRYLLLGAMTVVAVGLPFVPLLPAVAGVGQPWIKSLVVGAVAGAVAVAGWRDRRNFLLLLCCFLLVLRVAFDLFILPVRAATDERGPAVRNTARVVAERHADQPLAIYGHTLIEPATGWYLTEALGAVVPRHFQDFDASAAYIGSPRQYPQLQIMATDSLYLRHQQGWYPVGALQPPVPAVPTDEELRDGMGTGLPIRR
ncbi:4-amino-4-deoxy-L-arabinose transferase-like glycosyltransferase [Lewinella marina]|uniref:Glycosyl transferase n=1 Tax=Neolewinella marina TaxID=438751 RepID=A0A2G0CD72_9BACT|nr:glycosyl transferase [Neolewinella marina]NJB86890.1 4-amino-4-deoxy-L-arabinose transferase-like glycosyltransferase [Neolewinella marina]PHK97912.1 glycosyl transferase [Neolewinella marina]